MSTKSKSSKSTAESTGPGRPLSKVAWPKSKRFSFLQLCILNGALDKEGKALPKENRRMCPLTLRNHIERDMYKFGEDGKVKLDDNGNKVVNHKSTIQIVKGEQGKARTESGKGRKPLVYALRATLADEKANGKATKATKASKASTVSVPIADAAPADEKANGKATKATKASKASTVSVPIADAAPAPAADPVADPVTANADPVADPVTA